MEININEKKIVNAKKLCVHLKVSDCFDAILEDEDGNELKDYSDYVPNFMPGQHFGDYVILDIDIDTGQITNWEKPSKKQIEDFIGGINDED